MSTVIMQRWETISPEQYDQITAAARLNEDVPGGLQFHVACFEGSTLRMLDVWDTEEQFGVFVETRIRPAIEKLGVTGEPQTIVSPVHDLTEIPG